MKTKKENIRNLLSLLNCNKMAKEAVILSLSQKHSIPDDFVSAIIPILLSKENIQKLENSMIDIYDKHFNNKETKELIKFYSSSIGKKLISEMPLIFVESQVVGAKWGHEIVQENKSQIVNEIQKYIISKLTATKPQNNSDDILA